MAYVIFNEHHMLPSEYLKLGRLDKAAIIAFTDYKAKKKREEEREASRNRPKGKRGR